jgi:hypothetical protein
VLHQAIVSQPYVRKWPLGRGYLLLRQPPRGIERPGDVLAGGVGSRRAPAGVLARSRRRSWSASVPVARGGRRRGADPVPALVSVPGQSPSTGVAQLAAGPGGRLPGRHDGGAAAGGRAGGLARRGRTSERAAVGGEERVAGRIPGAASARFPGSRP